MKILTDDIEVFKILSDAGMENFDPLKKHVATFLSGNFWCLFLFNPSGKLKGCRLYILEQQTLDRELREKLLPDLLLLNDNHGYVILKNEALIVVESLISSRKENLFFDAH
jgi:hypothetical protein